MERYRSITWILNGVEKNYNVKIVFGEKGMVNIWNLLDQSAVSKSEDRKQIRDVVLE